MSDSMRVHSVDPTLVLRGTASGALFGASLVALGVAVSDAVAIASAGGGFRACMATAGAAFVLASIGTIVALVIVALVRAVLAAFERVGIDWSLVLLAMLGASLTVLGAQSLVLRVLSGHGIRTAAVALSGALGVAIAVVLAATARGVLMRAGVQTSVRLRATIMILALVAMLLIVIRLAPGLVDELDVRGLLASVAPVMGGLVGALVGLEGRRHARAAMGMWLLLLLGTGVQLITPTSMSQSVMVQRHTDATRMVFDLLHSSGLTKAATMKHAGTCHKGVVMGPIRGRHQAPSDAPDIVVITIDALRWDHTSLAGYQRDTTPRLSTWTKSAAVFSSAYTPASSTRQTFRSLFTGLFPSQVPNSRRANWWGVSLAPGQRTLARYLSDAGYLTVSVNDAAEGFDPKTGALQGFKKQRVGKTLGRTSGPQRAARATEQLDTVLQELRAEHTAPRFIWTHIVAVHQPYSVDKDSPYGNADIDRYDGAIRFVDRELGRLLDVLKDENRLKHTYVIVSADHGQAFREHGNNTSHGHTVYEEETHVPLLVWGPGVSAGRRTASVSTLDLFPTMIDIAQLDTVGAACGQSLLPTLRDATLDISRDVYMEQIPDAKPFFAFGLIHGSHKLLISPYYGTRELFDMRTDPGDQHDISDAQPALTARLTKALIDFQRTHGLDPASYELQ